MSHGQSPALLLGSASSFQAEKPSRLASWPLVSPACSLRSPLLELSAHTTPIVVLTRSRFLAKEGVVRTTIGVAVLFFSLASLGQNKEEIKN
jgi:hypothetical protein